MHILDKQKRRSLWLLAGSLFASMAVASTFANAAENGTYASGITPANFTIDQGTISLKMIPDNDPNGKSYFRYLAPDGVAQKWIQNFTSTGKCGYSVTSGNYVTLTAGGGSTSLVGYEEADDEGYALGVNYNGTQSSDNCTEISSGESLALDFRIGLGAGAFLDFANLDLRTEHSNTVITIKLYNDSTETAPTNLVYTYTRTGCGPESDGNDRIRVNVPINPQTVLFNRLVITASSPYGRGAEVSLKGGNLKGRLPSTFHVVNPGTQITCNTPISLAGGGTGATILFFPDVGSPCPTDKSYILNVATHKIEILTGGSTAHINTIVTSTWAPALLAFPVGATTVLPPLAGEPEVWCDGTPTAPMLPGPPGLHTWCRILQSTQIIGGGLMQVTETSLLEGDASRLR